MPARPRRARQAAAWRSHPSTTCTWLTCHAPCAALPPPHCPSKRPHNQVTGSSTAATSAGAAKVPKQRAPPLCSQQAPGRRAGGSPMLMPPQLRGRCVALWSAVYTARLNSPGCVCVCTLLTLRFVLASPRWTHMLTACRPNRMPCRLLQGKRCDGGYGGHVHTCCTRQRRQGGAQAANAGHLMGHSGQLVWLLIQHQLSSWQPCCPLGCPWALAAEGRPPWRRATQPLPPNWQTRRLCIVTCSCYQLSVCGLIPSIPRVGSRGSAG